RADVLFWVGAAENVKCSTMQQQCTDPDGDEQNQLKSQLPPMGLRNLKPPEKGGKQYRVAHELTQPQPPILEGDEQCGFCILERAPERHYFTSRKAASVVESTDGWYMGCTEAGLIRNLPGFTILSK